MRFVRSFVLIWKWTIFLICSILCSILFICSMLFFCSISCLCLESWLNSNTEMMAKKTSFAFQLLFVHCFTFDFELFKLFLIKRGGCFIEVVGNLKEECMCLHFLLASRSMNQTSTKERQASETHSPKLIFVPFDRFQATVKSILYVHRPTVLECLSNFEMESKTTYIFSKCLCFNSFAKFVRLKPFSAKWKAINYDLLIMFAICSCSLLDLILAWRAAYGCMYVCVCSVGSMALKIFYTKKLFALCGLQFTGRAFILLFRARFCMTIIFHVLWACFRAHKT